ncbi:HDL224Wp [Eremothecium sinecaudum]|uniref:U3 small nucleolar RNA-associated protein 25 n=1 Tax=Eremothecium sinecaudum TaxID=45286 RepID=A0A120K261_9SACH|nr:HDL224Wp [Eremothecium sinecaudum]AMD20520.1 HDL224Wp [Eremothecium sinecaudum]
MDSKKGRKQLRNITRAGGKDRSQFVQKNEDLSGQNTNKDVGDEHRKTRDLKHEDSEEESSKAADHKEEVYSAFLTLLKAEHGDSDRKSKKRKVVLKKEEARAEEEDSEESEASEESEEEDGAEEVEIDSEDEEDAFEMHFNRVEEATVNEIDKAFKNGQIKYKSVKLPSSSENEEVIYSKPVISGRDGSEAPIASPQRKQSLQGYFIKQKLKLHNNLMNNGDGSLSALQKNLVDPMFQYQDILYEYENYKQEAEYRDLYSLHVLNHVYKTRDRILKNNQRLQENDEQEHLDQGFTRPKVLVVVPSREVAYDVVNRIVKKSGIDQVDKKSKFVDQFHEDVLPPPTKPKSFQHIFKGNTNDFFILGLKFTRKAIKLYSNFYQSDIIICSPLGIQLILENTDKKKRQDDFLSSIEVMIIDQLHSIEFQNTSHVNTIYKHLNKIPDQQRDADFSRIRMWYINDQAWLFRQTMVFTRYHSPFGNSLINGKCRNIAGRIKNVRKILPEKSAINQLGLKVRQIFQRFDMLDGKALDQPNYRFKFFTSVIVPTITKSTGYENGILLYIPDYTDYVRVRNYLKEKTKILFGELNEYCDQKRLTSNRALFVQNRVDVMLYTERLHHFRRYELKGVKSVIFYQPPSNPEFYQEIVRYIGKSAFLGQADLNISTVRCLYSKLDSLALEKIAGTKRTAVLTHGQNDIYEFK